LFISVQAKWQANAWPLVTVVTITQPPLLINVNQEFFLHSAALPFCNLRLHKRKAQDLRGRSA
jgi:hypothetical protein